MPHIRPGRGDQDRQGLGLAGQETSGGGEDPGEDRLRGHGGSLLGEMTGA